MNSTKKTARIAGLLYLLMGIPGAFFFEILLPVAACLFVFGSVPKQMKNFFATGLIFLAISITRLQMEFFKERMSWPISLLITGVFLMVFAANTPPSSSPSPAGSDGSKKQPPIARITQINEIFRLGYRYSVVDGNTRRGRL